MCSSWFKLSMEPLWLDCPLSTMFVLTAIGVFSLMVDFKVMPISSSPALDSVCPTHMKKTDIVKTE